MNLKNAGRLLLKEVGYNFIFLKLSRYRAKPKPLSDWNIFHLLALPYALQK